MPPKKAPAATVQSKRAAAAAEKLSKLKQTTLVPGPAGPAAETTPPAAKRARLSTTKGATQKPDTAAAGKPEKPQSVAFEAPKASKPVAETVNIGRVRTLKAGSDRPGGPVVYWMSRDQRVRDNWALLYAVQKARESGVSAAVVFNLVPNFLNAKARHFGFMLRGLRQLEPRLKELNIPFFLLRGKAEETIPEFCQRAGASLLVMDFSPMRIAKQWKEGVCAGVERQVAVQEVDAHNVVPVWAASDKLEYSARTIRTKIHRNLAEYLVEYPELKAVDATWQHQEPPAKIEWDDIIADVVKGTLSVPDDDGDFARTHTEPAARLASPWERPPRGCQVAGGWLREVPEVDWIEAGEDAARAALLSEKGGFLTTRLKKYEQRNDPTKQGALSGLSPWLHYGHLSSQRCALEARKRRPTNPKVVDSFLEELVVRAELAENFCHYQPAYDSLQGAWEWARISLLKHADDKRDVLHT
eukprot:jgi/Mesen1/5776/ME000293S04931